MDVRCDKCQARYRIDDSRVGPQGLAMRCGKCATVMFAHPTSPPPQPRPGTVTPVAKPPASPSQTVLFGAAPVAPPQPAATPKLGAHPRATMLFGTAASAGPTDTIRGVAIPAATFPTPGPMTPPAVPRHEERASFPDDVAPSDRHTAGTEPPVARSGPPRLAIIGVAAAAVVLAVLAAVVAVKKLARRGPPQAAIEMLADAQRTADKDAVTALGEAEAQINAALLAASGARFPQAYAALAEVQVQWADALNDQAWFWGEKANRALAQDDDRKKGEAEAKAIALQDAAKSRLKAAFEAAAAGNKLDSASPDVVLALADYYRAARSRGNLNRELKRAALLKADPARSAFIEGADLASRDDGGPKAVERLKLALAAAPQSARIHFRLAMAYLTLHQDADAKKELLETLKLSPQHERAKMLLELLTAQGAPPSASSSEGNKQ